MEMTFPHHELRQDSVTLRSDSKKLLATVIARQAKSRTVCAMRRAEQAPDVSGDEVALLIRYFSSHQGQKSGAFGAFLGFVETTQECETSVYQSGLAYVKHDETKHEITGDQLNLAGQGALRKL